MVRIVVGKELVEREIVNRYCDLCGAEEADTNRRTWVHTCDICNREICDKCVGDSDYESATYFCKECCRISEPFRAKISALRKECKAACIESAKKHITEAELADETKEQMQ